MNTDIREPICRLSKLFGVQKFLPPRAYGRYEHFMGVPIIVDETLPDDVIEFRDADGRVLSRLLNVEWPQAQLTWFQRLLVKLGI